MVGGLLQLAEAGRKKEFIIRHPQKKREYIYDDHLRLRLLGKNLPNQRDIRKSLLTNGDHVSVCIKTVPNLFSVISNKTNIYNAQFFCGCLEEYNSPFCRSDCKWWYIKTSHTTVHIFCLGEDIVSKNIALRPHPMRDQIISSRLKQLVMPWLERVRINIECKPGSLYSVFLLKGVRYKTNTNISNPRVKSGNLVFD